MRRYLTLIFLLCLVIPAGVSFTGCTRNPSGNYCNGAGYGLKNTDLYTIDLEPRTTGISIAFGQTRQISAPTAKTCTGASASVSTYTYGTTNDRLVDVSPTGNICAGTWNRNSGGGIADYTICSYPNPAPSASGLPYATAFVTATASSVTSNPVEVYVHAPVSSISLSLNGLGGGQASAAQQTCYSQGAVEQLNSEACYASNGTQYELCAPAGTTNYACAGGLNKTAGVTSVPDCSAAIGVLSYTVGTSTVATISSTTNQITANLPGTTAITASIAGSGSSAGYFSTCPAKKISIALANGSTSGTVTQGVQQNLTTTVTDTNNNEITGLTLDYQSTNPLDITASGTGAITATFPGAASVYAICQPSTCNPAPINELGAASGTGLSISSNPVDITVPGIASSYVWFAAPYKSQYFAPIGLLSGSLSSTVKLPYVPNSMVMDQTGTNLYFGSSHELMTVSTATNSVSKQDATVPGVVLAVAPNNQSLLINDQVRKVFYLYAASGSVTSTFGGVGSAAAWTPDAKTLYITDSAKLGGTHSDALYVYNANTGWTSCTKGQPCAASFAGAVNLALTIPGVGAYFTSEPGASPAVTEARTWCPSGTVGNYTSMVFYPEGDAVDVQTDALAATTDGQHILGAANINGGITLTDLGVTIPTTQCPISINTSGPVPVQTLEPLPIAHPSTPYVTAALGNAQNPVTATAVNQIVTSPAAVSAGTTVAPYSLSFITYTGDTPGNTLPYYKQATSATDALGTVGYVSLNGASAVTAPVAGAFSSDGTIFFVSTSGDNLIHYISTTSLTDTQQIAPSLPECTPGTDPDCLVGTPTNEPVPTTVIVVKPRATT